MEIRNEMIEEIANKEKEQLNLLVRGESEALIGKFNLSKNNEYTEPLIHSVKILADLVYKGTEIHHSLTAPENVKNLFPDYNNLDFIESMTKAIENKPMASE